MKIPVVINGPPRAGKDTLVEMVRNTCESRYREHMLVHNISSVDQVKLAARLLGWDGNKDEKGREFLSDLKELSTMKYDGPLQYMLERLNQIDSGLVFFHIREPKEIDRFVAITGALTVLVVRDTPSFSNHADSNTLAYNYNYRIHNNGSWEDLQADANTLVSLLTRVGL